MQAGKVVQLSATREPSGPPPVTVGGNLSGTIQDGAALTSLAVGLDLSGTVNTVGNSGAVCLGDAGRTASGRRIAAGDRYRCGHGG